MAEIRDRNGERTRMPAEIQDFRRSASGFSFFFQGEELSGCSGQFSQRRAQENRKFLNKVCQNCECSPRKITIFPTFYMAFSSQYSSEVPAIFIAIKPENF